MSGQTETQTAWEETSEEVERRRQLAKSDDTGWVGTIVGVSVALITLFALTLLH